MVSVKLLEINPKISKSCLQRCFYKFLKKKSMTSTRAAAFVFCSLLIKAGHYAWIMTYPFGTWAIMQNSHVKNKLFKFLPFQLLQLVMLTFMQNSHQSKAIEPRFFILIHSPHTISLTRYIQHDPSISQQQIIQKPCIMRLIHTNCFHRIRHDI